MKGDKSNNRCGGYKWNSTRPLLVPQLHDGMVHAQTNHAWCRLQTDADGKQHPFTRRFLGGKLYTHWSDTCSVNERVVETVIPGHPMLCIQMTFPFTERQAIKSHQERCCRVKLANRLEIAPVCTGLQECAGVWLLLGAWRFSPACRPRLSVTANIYMLCSAREKGNKDEPNKNRVNISLFSQDFMHLVKDDTFQNGRAPSRSTTTYSDRFLLL